MRRLQSPLDALPLFDPDFSGNRTELFDHPVDARRGNGTAKAAGLAEQIWSANATAAGLSA
jgi:hypothetical protein